MVVLQRRFLQHLRAFELQTLSSGPRHVVGHAWISQRACWRRALRVRGRFGPLSCRERPTAGVSRTEHIRQEYLPEILLYLDDQINALLGIVYSETETAVSSDEADPLAEQVEALLAERKAARQAKDYARSDAIRDELEAMGIEVMDTPEGAKWRKKI